MGYNSFYGGKIGKSFILSGSFSSVENMINSFKQGENYKGVNFEEYVIIDTENKNNKDNGKIYKRGLDYNNDIGGAIYTGQVVGPSGPAPHVEGKTISEINNIIQTTGYDYRTSSGVFTITEGLVPGKDESNNFNDKITYKACSIRDEYNKESKVYIGFSFPYTVIDFSSEETSAYTTDELTSRIDDKSHPFYEKWKIKIPKGKKGDSFKNIRAMIANSTIQDYEGKDNDILNNREVLVYDQWTYEDSATGSYKTYYVGDYNSIKNVELKDDGSLIINYTHNDKTEFNKKIKWVTNTEVNGSTGLLKFTYNDGTNYTQTLNYIINTVIDSRYHLLVLYANPNARDNDIKISYNGIDNWTDLGYIGNGTGTGAIVGKESDVIISTIANALPAYSAWFILEEED